MNYNFLLKIKDGNPNEVWVYLQKDHQEFAQNVKTGEIIPLDERFIKSPFIDQSDHNYFVPDISDIKSGYECESMWLKIGRDPIWYNIKCGYDVFKNEVSVDDVIGDLSKGFLRVPYLTREQIEAEGFTFYRKFDVILEFLKNDQLSVRYNTKTKKLGIGEGLYYGECKDINTFRYICKLLKIN